MSLQLTEEEIAHIQERRAKNIEITAYNLALEDCYRIVAATPLSETRTETLSTITSLVKVPK